MGASRDDFEALADVFYDPADFGAAISSGLAGATILPPAPAFYHQPKTIEDLLNQTVGKLHDQFGIAHELYQRWEGR